jgi:hypothetical protein
VAAGKGRQWSRRDRTEVEWWNRIRDECPGLFRGTAADFKGFHNNMKPAIWFTA